MGPITNSDRTTWAKVAKLIIEAARTAPVNQ